MPIFSLEFYKVVKFPELITSHKCSSLVLKTQVNLTNVEKVVTNPQDSISN